MLTFLKLEMARQSSISFKKAWKKSPEEFISIYKENEPELTPSFVDAILPDLADYIRKNIDTDKNSDELNELINIAKQMIPAIRPKKYQDLYNDIAFLETPDLNKQKNNIKTTKINKSDDEVKNNIGSYSFDLEDEFDDEIYITNDEILNLILKGYLYLETTWTTDRTVSNGNPYFIDAYDNLGGYEKKTLKEILKDLIRLFSITTVTNIYFSKTKFFKFTKISSTNELNVIDNIHKKAFLIGTYKGGVINNRINEKQKILDPENWNFNRNIITSIVDNK